MLARAGVHNAGREAHWLAEAAENESELDAFVARRAGGEPLQYITGLAGFRHLELAVGPGVLVPRPETEEVTGRALDRLPEGGTLVDVGTGSGAIALAVKHERPAARVIATDVSDVALEWAERNRSRFGLDVTFLEGDLFAPLDPGLEGAIDVVVCNPPYVGLTERDYLPVDVRDHEPHVALFGGESGTDVIVRVITEARRWLRPGGWLVLEIGVGQGALVEKMLEESGYTHRTVMTDLAERPRIAEGRRPR